MRVPFDEGLVWLARDPRLALGAWNEALRRAKHNRAGLYRQMLVAAASAPEIRSGLRALALEEPELLLVFLAQATSEEVAVEVERVLREDPALKSLAAAQREALFSIWANRGNQALLIERFLAHPEWLAAGWRVYARVLAERKDFRAACELVHRFTPAPALPALTPAKSLAELRRALLILPNDFVTGFALYQAQMAANTPADALDTLRRLTAVPQCPKYFFYLRGQVEMQLEAWESAWRSWAKYLGI